LVVIIIYKNIKKIMHSIKNIRMFAMQKFISNMGSTARIFHCGLFLCPHTIYGSSPREIVVMAISRPMFEDFCNGKWAAVFSCLHAKIIKQL